MTSNAIKSNHSPGTTETASARAIAEDAALSLQDPAPALSLGVQPPGQSGITVTRAAVRGFSDLVAHIAMHHDQEIHRQLRPINLLHQRLFNEFERARCEVLGGARYSGSAANLTALWNFYGAKITGGRRSKTEQQLHHAIAAVREHLQLSKDTRGATATTPPQKVIPAHLLAQLTAAINNQQSFASVSLNIIEQLLFDSADVEQSISTKTSADSEPEDEAVADDSSEPAEDTDSEDTDDALSVTLRPGEEQSISEQTGDGALPADAPDLTTNRDAPVSTESDVAIGQETTAGTGYQVYSRSEDEVIRAAELCSSDQLVQLRTLLDQHMHNHARIIGKLSGKLQRVLMAEQTRHWEFNLAEGVLDTARLTRVVTQPHSALSFKQESDSQFKDTSITLLVDNSRSMLGKPITIAAACADLLSQTLERCGVSVEILGFTTTELHRGPLYERWSDTGANPQPGRLNGLRHIIYKPADVPYRRARMNFGVMLKKDLLKQNIDGESLQWAYRRLLRRSENRKVLIVISDGAPIDTSTMAVNRENILIEHLQQVIRQIESAAQVELLAIGIGHDVTRYYQHSMKIMDVRDLGKSLLTHISGLFTNTDYGR